jgi:hypothetical protein
VRESPVHTHKSHPYKNPGDGEFTRPNQIHHLDTHRTPRIFNVLPGGFLDLQHVRLIRGIVRSYLDGNYAVAIGACVASLLPSPSSCVYVCMCACVCVLCEQQSAVCAIDGPRHKIHT